MGYWLKCHQASVLIRVTSHEHQAQEQCEGMHLETPTNPHNDGANSTVFPAAIFLSLETGPVTWAPSIDEICHHRKFIALQYFNNP
jgi:hypothetical protein